MGEIADRARNVLMRTGDRKLRDTAFDLADTISRLEATIERLTAERDAAEGTLVREGWDFHEGRWDYEPAFGQGHMIQVRHGSPRHEIKPYARCWILRADPRGEDAVLDLHADTVLAAMEAADEWWQKQQEETT